MLTTRSGLEAELFVVIAGSVLVEAFLLAASFSSEFYVLSKYKLRLLIRTHAKSIGSKVLPALSTETCLGDPTI